MSGEVVSQSDRINEELDRILDESTEYRAQIAGLYPASGARTAEALECLQLIRPYLDRLEQALVRARRFRGGTDRALSLAKAANDDGWDRQATRSSSGFSRDRAPRERYAEYHLSTFDERVAVRDAERLHSRASEVEEAVRLMHRGADAIRSDLHVMIRASQFESSLER